VPSTRQIILVRRLGEATFWILLGTGLLLLLRNHLYLGLICLVVALVTLHTSLSYPRR
jgi:uncharacterized membrane protein